MRSAIMLAGMVCVVFVILLTIIIVVRRKRPLQTDKFQEQWVELQKLCKKKETWPAAIVSADHLLDEALKKKRIKGKNMGERMVKAQRLFTDNDGVWFAHKLRSKIESDPETPLAEADVKDALLAFRQALKDLGALPK